MGNEVCRIVFRRGGPLGGGLKEDEVPVQHLQSIRSPLNWWAPGLERAISQFRPDHMIAFGRNGNSALAALLRKRGGGGVVATVRTGRKLPGRYLRTVRASERVVCNSRFAAGLLEPLGIDGSRISVVENGCRFAERSLPDREGSRYALGVEEDELVILSLGSFVPGKRQHRLLSIWKQLSEQVRSHARLWFVGNGATRREVQRDAGRLLDSARVSFWGNRADVDRFLAAADVLVSVSQEESSPNAIVEALCAGVPVGALRCAGVEELIGDETGGAVFSDSEEGELQLRDWLCGFERSPAIVERARSFRKLAAERFDPDKRAEDYLSLMRGMSSWESGGLSR